MKRKKCNQCPKSFQSQRDLDRHMQKIHGLVPVDIPKKSDEEKSEFSKKCAEIMNQL